MDRNSMVSQSFQTFPETHLRPSGSLTTPVVRHSIYSMWMVYFSAVGPNSPRIFARFLQEVRMLPRRCPENAQVLNRPIGRAGRGANPRVRQFLEQERSFGKAAPPRAGSHDLKNPHLPFQRNRQDIARSDALGWSFDPPRRRTWPSATSRAARPRVLATRANHSHLSSRWRSATPFLISLQVPQ